MDAPPPPNGSQLLAYSISALTTLLWVVCVLPAGELVTGGYGDLSTPMFRERTFLVVALVLLIAGPAGLVLARRRAGLLSVLAATDAFIALYVAVVLTAVGAYQIRTAAILVSILFLLGALSVLESIRLARSGPDLIEPRWRGVRLAICVLVLLTPSFFFVQGDRELASLLAPFALLAISTGGAILARTIDGLKLTASLIYVALALHVLLTIRFTLFEAGASNDPAFLSIGVLGWSALGLSAVILGLTVWQSLRFTSRVRRSYGEAPLADPVS